MNILKALFYRRFETFSPQWRHEQYLRQLNICFLQDQVAAGEETRFLIQRLIDDDEAAKSARIQKIIDDHKNGSMQ